MNEYERLRRMSPEDLEALIEVERRAAPPRWFAWTMLAAGIVGLVVSIAQAAS